MEGFEVREGTSFSVESSVKALQQVMRGLMVRGMKFAVEKAHNVASSLFLWGIDGGDEGANIGENLSVGGVVNGGDVVPLFGVKKDGETVGVMIVLTGGVTMRELCKEGSNLIEHGISIKGFNSGVLRGAQCEAMLGGVGTIAFISSVARSSDVSEFVKAKLERAKVGAVGVNGSCQSFED